MDSATPILDLVDVSKRFEGIEGAPPVEVLRNINLKVQLQASLAIIGPSGSGKSTLLNIMGTLDRPSRGQVRLAGQELADLKEADLAAVRNREIGFIFQAHHLLPQCSVLENVLVPTLAGHPPIPGNQPETRARQLLDRVGLGARLEHRPGELSGGERQRVAVVRALINQPRLLLADEPTGALDRTSARALGQLLVELNREENLTLIVVTHALDLARRMNEVQELRDGHLQPWKAS